uniref:Beta-galactosidase n=1 Tax=Heterorhabditis bacteriophora TaxID=37862 RepID=A0A1I7WNQ4_HETBA
MDWNFHWTIHPIFGTTGDYPVGMKMRLKELAKYEGESEILPTFTFEEKLEIKGSADFMGVNYYRTQEVGPRTLSPSTVQIS